MKNHLFLIGFLLLSFCGYTQEENYDSTNLIVRLNFKLLDWEIVDDSEILNTKVSELLNEDGLKELKNVTHKSFNIGDLNARKIFPFMKTSDSLSLGRQGNTVYVPPFWATFSISVPKEVGYSRVLNEINQLYPLVIYAHPNYLLEFHDIPNDELFPEQLSLQSDSLVNAHIHMDSAWNIETGQRHIKVGVFDTGIDTTHSDLNILTGWGYSDFLNNPWGVDSLGHGTAVAGIIGARRNNVTGVSGIAGGNGIDTSGVSLIDFKYNLNGAAQVYDIEHLSAGIIDAARFVGSYYDWSPYLVNDGVVPYYDQTPGYGIHIGNHSYAVRKQATPNEETPQIPPIDDNDVGGGGDGPGGTYANCLLCRESFLFSLQNGVINIVSRGNVILGGPNNNDPYGAYSNPKKIPASYHDSWVISVGASGDDGERLIGGVNTGTVNEGWFSPQGNDLDVIAPGTKALVVTTKSHSDTTISEYVRFNGTSASAPHVSGVAALLLSRYNEKYCYSPINLDMADVEYIIQQSSTDKDSLGYDVNTGWGLLNAHEALKMIDFPRLQIVHPHDSILSTSLIQHDTISFFLENTIHTNQGGPISSTFPLENKKYYRVERLQYEIKYDFSTYMLPTTQLKDIWVRHSLTNSLMRINDTTNIIDQGVPIFDEADTFKIEPMAEIVDFSDSTVTLTGHYYHFIGKYGSLQGVEGPVTDVENYWYPINPNTSQMKMAYSIYIEDSTLIERYQFDCDSINNLLDTITPYLGVHELGNNELTVYPNPTSSVLNVDIAESNINGYLNIVDITGKLVDRQKIKNGKRIYQFDISSLEAGFYFLNLSGENTNISKKWVKR